MSFKKNAVTVLTAAVLAGTVGSAQAFWQEGGNHDNVGNGELLLVTYDDVAKVSVVQDLGIRYVDFYNNNFGEGGATLNVDLDPLFAETYTSGTENVVYSLFAMNNGVSFLNPNADTSGWMITSNGFTAPVSTQVSGVENWGLSVLGSNINGNDPTGDEVNSAYFGDLSNGDYAGGALYYTNTLAGQVSFFTTAAADESLMMYTVFNDMTTEEGAGLWLLDIAGGKISYSSVPVPAAVWLFMSGLLGFGAVARRGKTA